MATARYAVWNDWGRLFGNHFETMASTFIEIRNVISYSQKYKEQGNSEDLKQTVFASLLAVESLSNHVVGALGSPVGDWAVAGTAASRLGYNAYEFVQEWNKGVINVNRVQNIIADAYTAVGAYLSTNKNPALQLFGLGLSITGDIIGEIALETGDTGVIPLDEFLDMDNLEGFAMEKIQQMLESLEEILPDGLLDAITGEMDWSYFDDFILDSLLDLFGLDWYKHDHTFDQYLRGWREYSIYDPLVINLDGKGLSVASFKNTDGVMLDMDGDGIANKSSWVAAGNGVLFFDANDNNQFDDATELFSDSRLLSNGKVAENGFEAAKHYDSDGNLVIDQNDADFHKFKVLVVDENGEEHVLSLSDLGIVSLNLNYENTSQYLGDGNSITQIATYTKADGTTGQIGDVNFSYDTVESQYLSRIDLSDELLLLPNLEGVGFLRDLNQAAAISEELQNRLITYTNLQTKQEQLDYLFNLAQAWAKTSPYYDETALQLLPVSTFLEFAASSNRLTPAQFGDMSVGVSRFTPEEIPLEDRMKFEEIRVKYAILKEFLGVKSDTVYLTSARELKAVIASVEEDFDNLINDMYQGLLFQTRLRPYWEAMNLIVDENTLSAHWDFSAAEALFRSKWGEDSLNAAVDLGEFLQSLQWMEGFSLLGDWVAVAQSQGVADEYLALLGEGGFAMDYQTLDSAGTLKGSAKNDILQGSDADDQLEAGDGEDVINAADGNDRIYGGNGSDTILGGRGNDHIEDGDGDDLVDAGEGSDYIVGGKGSDTYVFKGDFGKDTIYNYYSGAEDVDVIEIQGRNRDAFRRLGGGVIRWRVEKGRGVRSEKRGRARWRTDGRLRPPVTRAHGRAPVVRQVRRRSNRCVRQTGFAAHRRAGAVRSSGIQTVNRHHEPACGGAIRAVRFAPLPDSAPDVSGGFRARCRRRT